MIRYMTAGESHGKALVAIIEGLPAGIYLDADFINKELKRRMSGYGRGKRMRIEDDKVIFLSGVKKGKTLGSPLAIMIENKDFSIEGLHRVTKARPGHADLAGALKYNTKDIRDILERASARESAVRVAVGSVAKLLLRAIDIDILSHVISIADIKISSKKISFEKIRKLAENSALRCIDSKTESLMKKKIDEAERSGDSLGGVCEIIISGVPVGLGSHVHWDRRLDANLARCAMSIPAVKGVEIGGGFSLSFTKGSRVHDEIFYDKNKEFKRKTNNAGGIEGGITNGENIVVRVGMKPIATLMTPLSSVDIVSKEKVKAQVERADICAVASCGVIAENVCAAEIASAVTEKFGGDSMEELLRNIKNYMKQIKRF